MGLSKLNAHRVVFCLLLAETALCSTINAQQQPPEPSEQKPLRFEFTPFVGYRSGMSFPIEPHVSGTNPSVVVDANPIYGASFGVRIEGDGLVEIRWARQDSNARSQNVNLPTLPHRVTLDQVHGDFSREYLVEGWGSWARPFVLIGVGATHISNSTTSNFTRFSFGIGGGLRFYPTRHFGFKVQAEWVPVLIDPQVAFVCGAGCIVHAGGSISSQGEVFIGPIVRF
jgi:hypothetical protein